MDDIQKQLEKEIHEASEIMKKLSSGDNTAEQRNAISSNLLKIGNLIISEPTLEYTTTVQNDLNDIFEVASMAAKPPKNPTIDTSKALSFLSSGLDDNTLHQLLEIDETDRRRSIPVKVSIDYNDAGVLGSIEPYDRAVLIACCQCWRNGQTFIYPSLIHRLLSGAKGQTKNNDEIMDSLYRLTHHDVSLHIGVVDDPNNDQSPKELCLFDGVHVTEQIFDGPMLLAIKRNVKVNGKWLSGYQMFATSPVYQYISSLDKVVDVPPSLVTCGNLYNTKDTLVMRYALIRIIHEKSVSKNNTLDININDFINECRFELSNAKKRSRYVKNIQLLLEGFKEEDFITDFEFHLSRNTAISFSIVLNKDSNLKSSKWLV